MMRLVVREPLFWLTAIVYLAWLSCSAAMGQPQERGLFIRQDCSSLTAPVNNETYCFHVGPSRITPAAPFTQGELYGYINSAWACKTCSGSDNQTIDEVFDEGRIATTLKGFINRAQFGNASNQGLAIYSDGVVAPARANCVVAGVEDNCDKGFGLNSGYKFFIQDSDGDDAVSYTEGSGAWTMQERSGNPSTPATGYWRYYFKSDGMYYVDDAGAVTGPLGGSTAKTVRAYNDANISINNDTDTNLTFNSERWDTDTMHDTGSNTGRITFTTAGYYYIWCGVQFAADSDGERLVKILLNVGETPLASHRENAPASPGTAQITVSTLWNASAGDYVQCAVHHTAGAALNVLSNGNLSPEFGAAKFN